jgi:histidine triad (HIT) family protein
MTPGHEALIGRMFSTARALAVDDKVSEGGYRLVVNTGAHGGQTVPHFHLHLIGGQAMHWPPG